MNARTQTGPNSNKYIVRDNIQTHCTYWNKVENRVSRNILELGPFCGQAFIYGLFLLSIYLVISIL